MYKIKLVPANTNYPFMRMRFAAFILSGLLILASLGMFFIQGLNKGIDFEGGILVEVGLQQDADLGAMRSALSGMGLGEVALQEFGRPQDVLIRIERQPGDAEAQNAAVAAVKERLATTIGGDISYRRVEFVGPKISGELVEAGRNAVLIAVACMLIYIWFRFEWQFSIGAVAALVHDVLLTIGMFAITGIEFNLSSVAAILTIVGYSVNDTVVVYDRVRENLRRYKSLGLVDLLNKSINETLARTTMTSVTTLLALFALFLLGGEIIRGFSFAMIWGVVIGTYSSIFVATPLLIHLKLQRRGKSADDDVAEEAASS